MSELFVIATRNNFLFASPQGNLTVQQLWRLPLTSTVANKANLNDVAVALADEIDKVGTRSFVDTASTDPRKTELNQKLEVVKYIIATVQAESQKEAERRDRKARREKILNAIEAAENRELGSKSAADLRAELANLED